eukprot:Blabericola_migrator_1__10133@NODE_563_length_7579_cov_24_328940_g421_i0_p1_GENE_NODE_563_length_7579_cov_24_328940_g421_i0NODE_563_length_7579_cov_24_328940_g421_i0_p1_ORF_typecomplete_len1513_score415_92Pkinase_Tyr/PF07714_17/8_7e67Pkinase/PF00069_25/2_9e60TPR_MalT/PF17874_1/8_3TPR_MalT/PF17874_1/1_3TPR_MalT/PF17874_1/9_5e05ANAPC3/PF12895_7/5_3e03ANAPC3/PF12895_7/5_3e03ANAPC3/PF12895_7/21ANAPC3/PF12895_7/6_5ANAPC3/PF12895_7/0_068ANAPC3/PF12895_7/0_14ANAPC3/PF12895_7/3_1Kinaselike/PF14531_6/8e0
MTSIERVSTLNDKLTHPLTHPVTHPLKLHYFEILKDESLSVFIEDFRYHLIKLRIKKTKLSLLDFLFLKFSLSTAEYQDVRFFCQRCRQILHDVLTQLRKNTSDVYVACCARIIGSGGGEAEYISCNRLVSQLKDAESRIDVKTRQNQHGVAEVEFQDWVIYTFEVFQLIREGRVSDVLNKVKKLTSFTFDQKLHKLKGDILYYHEKYRSAGLGVYETLMRRLKHPHTRTDELSVHQSLNEWEIACVVCRLGGAYVDMALTQSLSADCPRVLVLGTHTVQATQGNGVLCESYRQELMSLMPDVDDTLVKRLTQVKTLVEIGRLECFAGDNRVCRYELVDTLIQEWLPLWPPDLLKEATQQLGPCVVKGGVSEPACVSFYTATLASLCFCSLKEKNFLRCVSYTSHYLKLHKAVEESPFTQDTHTHTDTVLIKVAEAAIVCMCQLKGDLEDILKARDIVLKDLVVTVERVLAEVWDFHILQMLSLLKLRLNDIDQVVDYLEALLNIGSTKSCRVSPYDCYFPHTLTVDTPCDGPQVFDIRCVMIDTPPGVSIAAHRAPDFVRLYGRLIRHRCVDRLSCVSSDNMKCVMEVCQRDMSHVSRLYEELLSHTPNSDMDRVEYGRLLLCVDRRRQALKELERVKSHRWRHDTVWLCLISKARYHCHDLKGAIESCSKINTHTDLQLLEIQANCYHEMFDDGDEMDMLYKALELFRQLITLDPYHVRAMYLSARAFQVHLRQSGEAARVSLRLIERIRDPEFQSQRIKGPEWEKRNRLLSLLSLPMCDTGRVKGCVTSEMRRVFTHTDCNDFERWTLLLLGDVSIREGRLSDCQRFVDSCLEKRSNDNLEAGNLKAMYLMRNLKYETASMFLSSATAIDTKSSETSRCHAFCLLAFCHERLDNRDIAEHKLGKALEIDGSDFEANLTQALLVAKSEAQEDDLLKALGCLSTCEAGCVTQDETALVKGVSTYIKSHICGFNDDHTDIDLTLQSQLSYLESCPRSDLLSASRISWLSTKKLRLNIVAWRFINLCNCVEHTGNTHTLYFSNEDTQIFKEIVAYIHRGVSGVSRVCGEEAEKKRYKKPFILSCVELEDVMGKLHTCFTQMLEDSSLVKKLFDDLKEAMQNGTTANFDLRKQYRQTARSHLYLMFEDVETFLDGFANLTAALITIPEDYRRAHTPTTPHIPAQPHIPSPDTPYKPHPGVYRSPNSPFIPPSLNNKRPLQELFKIPILIPAHKILKAEDLIFYESVGSGGFGTVYAGELRLKNVKRQVAIKVLKMPWSKRLIKDLLVEINVVSQLTHPSLVEFVGACLDLNKFCLVTELGSNGSLYHTLHEKKKPWPWNVRLRVADQLAAGVEFLHTRNPVVIHRDLKSLNVVLDRNDSPKICDFGLTNKRKIDESHLSLKKIGNGGSPRYMAPEFHSVEGHISEKVDIWALGCVLTEIFGGPVPFKECKAEAQIYKSLMVDKRGPHIPSKFPSALRDLLNRCFAFDPKERPSATEIRQSLALLNNPCDCMHPA